MKIAIVVGHNSKAQGAVRVTDGRSEFDWNNEVAKLIESHDPSNIKIFTREFGGGYSKEIDRVYKQTDDWGADLTVELHFNGSVNSKANGCLTLSSGTKNSMRLARLMQVYIPRALGNKDRGVVIRGRHDRGGRSLWQGKAPAVMLEPYFGSNAAECMKADHSIDEYAEAVYRACKRF